MIKRMCYRNCKNIRGNRYREIEHNFLKNGSISQNGEWNKIWIKNFIFD